MDNNGWVPDPAADFGARLALVRQHQRWNMTAAARACGQEPANWQFWETRGRMPRDYRSVCEAIADQSGCDYVWLLTGESRYVTREYQTAWALAA